MVMFLFYYHRFPLLKYTLSALLHIAVFFSFFLFKLDVWNNIRGWKGSPSPVKELLLPTGLWINFLMLPFQNKHSVLNWGSRVCMRAETESDGGGGAGSLHLVGQLRASVAPPHHTKLTLCKISGGHQEGPIAIFSQSQTVCFLWVSEPECVRRWHAGRQSRKMCWDAPLGEEQVLQRGGLQSWGVS